jgi:hypothetical protein
MKKIVWPVITSAFLVGMPLSLAWGQTTDPQAIAAAQSLVDEASELMDANKFDAACPKLEQATKLVPTGIGARLALAECYVGQGKLASAQGQYLQAEAMASAAKDAKRAKEAAVEAGKLKSKIATITLVVPAEVQQIAGGSLTWDDVVWEPATWGAPIPVDMGKHRLEVKAPGYKPWKQEVNVEANGRAMEQAVPMLEKLPPEVAKPLPPRPKAGRVESTSSLGPIVWAGLGLMILGVGGGTGFVVAAINKDKDAAAAAEKISLNRNVDELLCPISRQDPACSDLNSLESQRNLFANIGIAGIAVGGAAAATVMVFVFTGPNKAQRSATNGLVVVPTPGGVSISGTF